MKASEARKLTEGPKPPTIYNLKVCLLDTINKAIDNKLFSTCVTLPISVPTIELDEALKALKEAGYTVKTSLQYGVLAEQYLKHPWFEITIFW
jgi:hypothetical protein